MGHLKGRTAIRLFSKFPCLLSIRYGEITSGQKGCRVDSAGVNAEMMRKYVKYQEKHEVDDNSYRYMKR